MTTARSCRAALPGAPPCPLPLVPVLPNSSSPRARALGTGARPYHALGPGRGRPALSCSGSSSWRWGPAGCCAPSTAGCGAVGPSPSAWTAEYIFYLWKTSIFLGSNSSCHHVDRAGFLTLAFSPSSRRPGGPRPLHHIRVITAEPGKAPSPLFRPQPPACPCREETRLTIPSSWESQSWTWLLGWLGRWDEHRWDEQLLGSHGPSSLVV